MAKMLWLRSILYKGALWIVRKEENRDLSCEGYFNPVNTLLCECRITVTYGDILQKIADNADRAMSQRRLFLDSALTLDKLAREIGCNRTYLSRALAQKKKMNYRNYLNDYRIKYAKELLSHKDYTLLDVAIISGFRNEKTFYNAVVQSGDKSWKSVKKRYL